MIPRLLLAAALAGLFSLSSRHVLASDFDSYMDAGFALKKISDSAGKLPRVRDPKGAILLAHITNLNLLRTVSFENPERRDELYSLCAAAGLNSQIYLQYQIDLQANDRRAQTTQMLRNAGDFQDELTLLLPFMSECLGSMIPLVEAGIDKDKELASPHWLILGIRQVLFGYVQALASEEVTQANRKILSSSLMKTAPAFVTVMRLTDRGRLRKTIQAFLPAVPAHTEGDLARLDEMLADQSCENICAGLEGVTHASAHRQ
jgi:hypothetical protein